MTLSKKSKQLLRELNTLMGIRPLSLSKCKPKCINYIGNYGMYYSTLGVEAEQVRIYKSDKFPSTLAFSSYFIKGVQWIKISTEDNNHCEGRDRERNHLDVDMLSVDEFHDKLKKVLRLVRGTDKGKNLEYMIDLFTAPEYIL